VCHAVQQPCFQIIVEVPEDIAEIDPFESGEREPAA